MYKGENHFDKNSHLESFGTVRAVRDTKTTDFHMKNTKSEINEIDISMSQFTPMRETQWQESTFLNDNFTQLNELFTEENILVKKEINNAPVSIQNKTERFAECIQNKDTDSTKLCLTRREEINDLNIPEKKQKCDSNHSNEEKENITPKQLNVDKTNNFYGLPNNVKRLYSRLKGIDSLYQWQDECLKSDAVNKRKNLIYALPTSGGKTLVAEILMLREVMCNKKNAIFVLPFVALVQEKVQSMASFALELGFLIEEYAAAKGHYPPKKRRKKNSIYICTIEKALGLVNSLIETKRFHEVGLIVVDELHLLGENGGRGATLEGLLTKAMYSNENAHIVGMSATIGNLDEIATFLNAELYTQNFRPVEIKEYVKCEDNIWLVDPRTEELLTDLKKINYRYSDSAVKLDPDKIGGLVMDVVPKDSCLIFCASRKNCENVALLLTKVLPRSVEEYKQNKKKELLSTLRTEEGLCPILKETIKFGIAYHHSGLTAEERRLIEDAFKEGTLCVICCTSTLAAGVNLPARRVILRSPYVGNEFINLSRYKQMIGRAGRAGLGTIGESILICKINEIEKVKELLTSKMDDSLSTLHTEVDRGINNLILSSVLFSIAKTRQELFQLVGKTLLGVQCKRLDVNVKKLTDETIVTLLKRGVLKANKSKILNINPNVTVALLSQDIANSKCVDVEATEQKSKKVIALTMDTKLELSDLGRAAMKASIDLQTAYVLYQDLKTAQKHLVLLDYLHLLYLVTPYDIVSQIKPIGSIYYNAILNLTATQMETARLLGLNEAMIIQIRNGITPKNVEGRVLNRFYVTLIIYELWSHRTVYLTAQKYEINRGIVQNLLNLVSGFASSVVRFCEELEEFWSFRDLFSTFSKKISYCCPEELEALMELPSVKIGRARQLYKAGYTTLQLVAKADPKDMQEKIPYLSRKLITQIIATANLLLLEKVENLRDEADDVFDGIDKNQLRILDII